MSFRKSMLAAGATGVRFWEQGTFIKKNKTLKPQGVCGPLALAWIRIQAKGGDFESFMRTDDALQEVLLIERLKKTEKDYCKEYLSDYNLFAHFEQKLYPPMRNGVERIVKAGPGYYFVGASRVVWANEAVEGHAFGVDMFKNAFFDPNIGIATFRTSEAAAKALILWLDEGYSDYNAGIVQRFF